MRSDREMLGGVVAIVTGAAQGIGRATSEVLARYGAAVVVADVQEAKAAAVAAALCRDGRTATGVRADVTDATDVRTMVDTARGLGSLAVIVNNATGWAPARPLMNISDEAWDREMSVMLKSFFLVVREAAPRMVDGGSVVNISSVHGLLGSPGSLTYDVAKAGIVQMTRVMACELGIRGIRVNAIAPGIIDTESSADAYARDPDLLERHRSVSPLKRIGSTYDVAEAVAFLASDRARFVTGQTLAVDGGLTSVMQLSAVEYQWRRMGIGEPAQQ